MKVDKVKNLLKTANEAETVFDRYKEATNESRCDKHGLGFNLDSRFSSAKITLSIDSWTGYYGNSGCGVFFRITDKEVFEKHLLKVIQSKFKSIIQETADSIRNEATELKEKALKELQDDLNLINSL